MPVCTDAQDAKCNHCRLVSVVVFSKARPIGRAFALWRQRMRFVAMQGEHQQHAERRQRARDHEQRARTNLVSDHSRVAATVSATREHAHARHVI